MVRDLGIGLSFFFYRRRRRGVVRALNSKIPNHQKGLDACRCLISMNFGSQPLKSTFINIDRQRQTSIAAAIEAHNAFCSRPKLLFWKGQF